MHANADKGQDNQNKAAANESSLRPSSGEATVEFVDNRAEAVQLRKLQAIAVSSPRMTGLEAMSEAADRHKVMQLSITPASAEQHPDEDAAFLEGLGQRSDNAHTLCQYAGKISRRYFTGNHDHGLNFDHTYVDVGNIDEQSGFPGNLNNIEFWRENEQQHLTIPQMLHNYPQPDNGDGLRSQLANAVLDDRVKGGAGGNYGNMNFRFEVNSGTFFHLPNVPHPQSTPNLQVVEMTDPGKLAAMQINYSLRGLPYAEERRGPGFLFVHADHTALIGGFGNFASVKNLNLGAGLQPAQDPVGGAAGNKIQARTFPPKVRRGSRGQGQAAAMGGYSARDYVALFAGQPVANACNWEWLHVRASRLGGPNTRDNLVAGTYQANSQMIPWEKQVYDQSRTATHQQPVGAEWTATRRTVNGVETHIGDKIRMTIRTSDGERNKEFNCLENAPITRFDRDRTVQ